MIKRNRLSSMSIFCAIKYTGNRPATTGSIFVDRKKNITSVHLRTGRIDNAYAVGIASTSISAVASTAAVSELARYGHGFAPPPAQKKSRYPSSVSGAPMLGGFVLASASLWNEFHSEAD